MGQARKNQAAGRHPAGGMTPLLLQQQDHDQRIAAARARRRRVYPEARRGPLWTGGTERAAAIDRAELIDRLDGDEALCDHLLQLFVVDAPQALARIEQAVAAADAPLVQREAHSLRGAAAYVAARLVQRAAEQLERAGRDGDLARADGLLRPLAREISRVCRGS